MGNMVMEEIKEFRSERLHRAHIYLTEHFPTTPLIAMVLQGRNNKYYGPFENGYEAYDWLIKQPWRGVRFIFTPLRNPYIKRTASDFYLPEKHEDFDKEHDHTIRESQ